MVKGVSIKFRSYGDTIPKLLEVIKFGEEIKKHDRIVLKPNLHDNKYINTSVEFVEEILKFIMLNKNPGTKIFIAEGHDGAETKDVFERQGYGDLAEKYDVGLIDLNKTECVEINNEDFLRFDSIMYPKILLDSFVISLAKVANNEEDIIATSLRNMVGAFPAQFYSGFFSSGKNKIKKWPLRYQVHDIIKCKMPDFSILDSSEDGYIFAGQPLEIDKQAVKSLGIDWRSVNHLKLIDESLSSGEKEEIL
jgi:uncharacterized protein (DUF362 family)